MVKITIHSKSTKICLTYKDALSIGQKRGKTACHE